MQRRLGTTLAALASLTVSSCGGDAQLRSEVADLRISVQAIEARQEKLERKNGSTAGSSAETPEVIVLGEKNSELESELEKLRATQLQLLEQLNQNPTQGAPPRPKRLYPDKASVYAIDLGQSPFSGPLHAKVTIVEAFEFA